jgi:signal peptidase I
MIARLRAALPSVIAYVLLGAVLTGLWKFYVPVRVIGGSMRPALAHGDIALVARNEPPVRGSIVLFRSGSAHALHRIVGAEGDDTFVTRGDANPIHDFAPAAREDIAGVVVAVLPVGTLLERWR